MDDESFISRYESSALGIPPRGSHAKRCYRSITFTLLPSIVHAPYQTRAKEVLQQ